MKQFAPFLINITEQKILIIGGGKAALLKARGIYRFTSHITVLSPDILDELEAYPFFFIRQKYKEGLINDFFMVYACTDDMAINQQIKTECENKKILYTICNDPDASFFATPAIYKNENITISVGTNASNPKQAISIRNQIQQLIEKNILKI